MNQTQLAMRFFIFVLIMSQLTWSGRLFQRDFNDPTDTLEIFALKVEFKRESPDKLITTGNGTFNSDPSEFKLDPSGARNTNAYWESHLKFAQNYYQQVSQRKLHIDYQVFPKSSTPWKLDKEILDYNRSTKLNGEKNEELDSARVDGYLKFIRETITLVSKGQDTPFDIPLSPSPNRKRIYLIIHAGANRLVDGGSLGTQGADSPSDFFDAYLGPKDFEFYQTIPEYQADTHGIVLNRSGVDTLNRLMVISETASQDDINWGINGILVSQIGEALGLPGTYDPTRGTTQLGQFDLMDFGGYSAGNGFFPVAPSAWHRNYLKWEAATTVSLPADTTYAEFYLKPATQSGSNIIKIPINLNEYLLVEYRIKTPRKKVSIYNAKGQEYKAHADSISQLFLDTICNDQGLNCQSNRNQVEGVIESANHFDLSLPASGVLFWKVNDWLIQETIETGFINRNLEKTGDHYKGLTLVEPDGILTMGKEFKNALGQPSFDFGSGKEMLPHILLNSKDTITTIHPWGYGNTGSTQGGYSHIRLSVDWPDFGFVEKNSHSFSGDSISNIRSDSLKLTIDWGDFRIPGSLYPVEVSSATHPQSLIKFDHILFIADDFGAIEIKTDQGERLAKLNSTPRIFKGSGLRVKDTTEIDYIHLTHNRALISRWVKQDGNWKAQSTQRLKSTHFKAGPLIVDSNVFFLERGQLLIQSISSQTNSISFQENYDQMLFSTQDSIIYLLGRQGHIAEYDLKANQIREFQIPLPKIPGKALPGTTQTFRGVLSDFNRDGSADIFAMGSQGYSFFADLTQEDLLVGSPFWSPDIAKGGVAVADINRDGYSDIILAQEDQLQVIDYRSQRIPGFPFRYTTQTQEGDISQTPLIFDLNGDQSPDILSSSPWGLLYAINSQGQAIKTLPGQSASLECLDNTLNSTGQLKTCGNSFPLNIGPSVQTRKPTPYSMMASSQDAQTYELFSSGASELHAWRFSQAKNASNQWLMEGGNYQRHYFFDASLLEPQKNEQTQSIQDFYIYPSPLRATPANLLLNTGAPYQSARLRILDASGQLVHQQKFDKGQLGFNRLENLDLNHLATGVYTARIDVHFDSQQRAKSFFRFGVIR